MKSTISLLSLSRLTLVIALSFAAGMINGTLGAGSGIVFMLLSSIISNNGDGKNRYSFAMTCVFIISLISLILYPSSASSNIPLTALIPAVVCGVIGGTGGAILKDKVKISWLNLAFALLTIYSGLSMVLRR